MHICKPAQKDIPKLVALISEKGIAKVGSYNDPGYDVRIASIKKYAPSSVEIGFRVAMEVLEK